MTPPTLTTFISQLTALALNRITMACFMSMAASGFELARKKDLRLPVTKRWYHVRLIYDGQTGAVQVIVDGQSVPALHAVDLSLRAGKVAVGSFDETGDFKSIKIQ